MFVPEGLAAYRKQALKNKPSPPPLFALSPEGIDGDTPQFQSPSAAIVLNKGKFESAIFFTVC